METNPYQNNNKMVEEEEDDDENKPNQIKILQKEVINMWKKDLLSKKIAAEKKI